MLRRLTLVLVLATGCGVKVSGTTGDDTIDAAPDANLQPPFDMPPDARPCAGGDNHAADSTGACFLFFATARTRADAQSDCVANGASLAIIRNAEQNGIAASLATGVDAFIGATDAATESTFLWPDGSGIAGFSNFRVGEPNNANGAFEEDCLVIEGAKGGTWDDRPCALGPPNPAGSGAYAYLCQF